MNAHATAPAAERSDLIELSAPMTAIDSRRLAAYADEAWEISARMRGALLLLGDCDGAETSDEVQLAMRLIRAGIKRAEGLALAAFDGHALDAEGGAK